MTMLEERPEVDEAHLHEMSIINLGGDTKHKWDPTKAVEVEAARKHHDDLKSQGYTAQYKDGRRMSEFDPEAKTMLMVPVMTAG